MKRRDLIVASASLAGVLIPGLGRAAQPCPPPQVSLSGGSSASTTCEIVAPGSSYTTSFAGTENPISEGGRWTNPRAAGFTNVRTANGNAFGTQVDSGRYDDSYAYLSGFSADHEIEGVVHRGNPTGVNHEVELHLRMSDDATNVRSYEFLFGFQGAFQVMRWNGPLGPNFFTEITGNGSPSYGPYLPRAPISGDVVKVRAVSNRLTAYFNGAQIWTGVDPAGTFASGQPGIAFFIRGTGNAEFGFSSITARNV